MATLKFYLNSKPGADGLYIVYLRLSVSRGCVLRGRTSVRISDRDWDKTAGRPKKAVRIATPWTAAYQAPPSMGLSRQEYWSGVPLPSLFFHYRTL